MNFLAFREQIYDWTLDNDQNLFNQVNQLTQYIFQTEKNINESIAITRASLNQSSTILNNNFNHYLRLSENKFTENKIAEPKKLADQDVKKQQTLIEPKPKMQIYKEALNISLKNLQIKQEEKQADNVSLSQLSLSQAIFKNARLPPYFGSKQFRAQKFLSLFFDQDLGSQSVSKKQIQSLSNQPLSTPTQNAGVSTGTNNSAINGYLPPPPSLESLNLGSGGYSGSMNPNLPPPPSMNLPPPPSLNLPPPPPLNLPPPPPLNLPPPPPLTVPAMPNRQSMVQIDESDENKDLLLSIMASTKNNNQQPTQNIRDSFVAQNRQPQPLVIEQPKPVQKRPMTLQEELALKLKLGKDYKAPPQVIQPRASQNVQQNTRNAEVSQPVIERSSSFRQSAKIQDIIGGVSGFNQSSKPASKQTKPIFEDDEEEQSALFGSGKRKVNNNQAISQPSQSSKVNAKNEADIMMSRSTFNEDTLFKKKPIFSKQAVMPAKTQQKQTQKIQKKPNKASAIFNQDSDQQDDFTFKKKVTKKTQQVKPKQSVPQKKTNPLLTQSKKQKSTQQIQQPIKKSDPEPKKKAVNKLFGGDSDQEEDIFAKKKNTSKKNIEAQSPTKTVQQQLQTKKEKVEPQIQKKNPLAAKPKKNTLFNDDQDEDFSFKPKSTKKQSKDQAKQQKKPNLFNDDQEQDFPFKPKAKTDKKEKADATQQKAETIKPVENNSSQNRAQKQEKAQTLPKKDKNPLFGGVEQEDQDNLFSKKAQKKQKEPQVQETKQINEQETEQQAKLRKIARMGGQPMMGIAQMMTANIPKRKQHIEQINQLSQQKADQKIVVQYEIQQDSVKKDQPAIVNVSSKRPLDHLQKLVTDTVNTPQNQERNNQNKVQKADTSDEVNLEVRRKKNKPKKNLDDIFDQEDSKSQKPKKIEPVQTTQKQIQTKIIQPVQKKANPLFDEPVSSNSEKQAQISKIAKMSMAGVPQMGLGPLIPKGLIITKPSQAKKMQQQALQRIKLQEEQRAIREKQQQEQKEKIKLIQSQQEQIRRARQQQLRLQQQQEQKRRLQQERLRKQKFQQQRQMERKKYQQQRQKQKQMQRLRLVEEEKQRLAEEQQRLKRMQQEEQIRRNQERRKLQAQKEKKANLPLLPNFDSKSKNQTLQNNKKNKNSNPLDVPKLPPKTNPLGGLSKSPLGGPLGNSLGNPLGGSTQKSSGSLGLNSLPQMPSIPTVKTSTQKNTGKKSLFDDDQQDTFQSKKPKNQSKPTMPTINQKKKGGLFDDDQDDAGFGMKSKPKATQPAKKKGLFDDDEDEGLGFGKKPVKKTLQPKQEPIKRLPEPPKIQEEIKPQTNISQKPKSKNLFGEDDQQEQIGFGKKKVEQVKQAPTIQPVTNNLGSKQVKSKKGLFAGSQDEDQNPIKPAKNVPVKQNKSKKGLFGGSSDSDDDVFKKKNNKKPEPPKQSNLTQNSSLNSPQKNQNNLTNPLIPSKKSQTISPIQIPSQSQKNINPLSGPLNSSTPTSIPVKNQPLNENTQLLSKPNPLQQQKKRNIFEESEEQSESSPMIATKQKVPQKPVKKGLIQQDSQDQKPIKPVPVKEEEPEPTVVSKANNNRKLFDESQQDSQDQEMLRKKRMANSKLKKLF